MSLFTYAYFYSEIAYSHNLFLISLITLSISVFYLLHGLLYFLVNCANNTIVSMTYADESIIVQVVSGFTLLLPFLTNRHLIKYLCGLQLQAIKNRTYV